jgi:Ca2+:H+ antiporter
MSMTRLFQYPLKNPLSLLLLLFPLAIIANLLHWNAVLIFFLSAVGIIPFADFIGKGTESLAAYVGPHVGGLLNATLGNAAELIITLIAIRAGLLDLVKASITGSILGNLLLVLGASFLLGGMKNGVQKFDKKRAGNHAVLLTLAILALVVPSLFSHSIGPSGSVRVEALSIGVAIVMVALYVVGLIYTMRGVDSPIAYAPEKHETKSKWSIGVALGVLVLATAGVAILSEILVGAVEDVVVKLGISEFFLGIILIPIIGNVAEHLVAVQVSLKNKMDLSVEIAVSSSLQIALFVAPVLVFVSLALGHPLTLIFNIFELIALGSAVIITALVSADGESNWLEGSALLAVYIILALAFFLLPA